MALVRKDVLIPLVVVIIGLWAAAVGVWVGGGEPTSFLAFVLVGFVLAVLVPAGLLQLGLALSLRERAGTTDLVVSVVLYQQLAVLGYLGFGALEEKTRIWQSVHVAQDVGWFLGLLAAVVVFSEVKKVSLRAAGVAWIYLGLYHLVLMLGDLFWGEQLLGELLGGAT